MSRAKVVRGFLKKKLQKKRKLSHQTKRRQRRQANRKSIIQITGKKEGFVCEKKTMNNNHIASCCLCLLCCDIQKTTRRLH